MGYFTLLSRTPAQFCPSPVLPTCSLSSSRYSFAGSKFYSAKSYSYPAPDEYFIEPDASAAMYPLTIAALTGKHVCIPGLRKTSLQGDYKLLLKLGEFGKGIIWSRTPAIPLPNSCSLALRAACSRPAARSSGPTEDPFSTATTNSS